MEFGLNIPKLLKINIQSVLVHNKPFGLHIFCYGSAKKYSGKSALDWMDVIFVSIGRFSSFNHQK
jgi:hypothetical protein